MIYFKKIKLCIILILLIILGNIDFALSQDELILGEVRIKNHNLSDIIKIQVYPVGCVFNGDKEYKLRCRLPDGPEYIIGGERENLSYWGSLILDNDAGEAFGDVDGAIGYGKYRVDFYKKIGTEYDYVNYCYFDYSTSNYPWTIGLLDNDIDIEYRSETNIRHNGNYELPPDKTIKIWDQRQWNGENAYENQNKNGFKTTTSDQFGNWLNFPHFATYFGGTTHEKADECYVWMDVLAGHQPKILCGYSFIINSSNFLKLKNNSSTKLYIGNSDNNPTCGAEFIINTGSLVWLEPNTQIICEKSARIIFRNQSHGRFDESTSKIFMKPGSLICFEGSPHFYGTGYNPDPQNGSIVIQGLVKKYCPSYPTPTNPIFEDSIKVFLDTNSILELGDSITLTFEGYESGLICDSGSTIKFGKDSKLVFTDGARIKAKHTKFTSVDSTETWNGIYMSDIAFDTLQYCTIENAENGLNIEDKTSMFTSPATEISNCTFSNTTETQLLNMVYVNNSSNVMIRNCSTSSVISDGFASGIIIEYSTAGGVNVIDNEISYVTTGINVIQSSPYIARNLITGAGSSGTGIYLDNSNGTIEYNTVNNFENSTLLYYSTPYMLKNTFNNPDVSCAYLTAYSAPIMRPIVSGATLRWLGGNNYLTGGPSRAGIIMEDEGHPLMDSGYNVISVGSSLYMQGTISRQLDLRVNYWYDNPPVLEKFDISGENFDYSDYFDGESIPATDYYETNPIGFGYYDTVYVDEFGDNLSAEEMFILAYRNEMEGQYSNAITQYKEVVSTYKTSNYATSSLSRIFNCLEKSNSNINGYSAIKSYYDGLKSSNTYPVQIRELSEDLAIKSKVRMGYLEEAISDYQSIINNNPNTPKGLHAQINKLCLENMNEGGDNLMFGPGFSNNRTNEGYKSGLLSLITGKKIDIGKTIANNTPKQLRLYQNYPNPFNPITTIKYEIPKNGQVSLKIYDITGRKVFSINEYRQAGSYSVTFDGTNFASGLYLYQIKAGNFVETKKMVLIK